MMTAQEIITSIKEKIQNKIIEDIKNSWSSTSPSQPNMPPAKVTGTLEKSISKDGKDIIIDAPYAADLEYGHGRVAPRPFVRPVLNNFDVNNI
jgi:hypothetical protein